MQELAEEKARLEFEMKTSFSESANLEDELQRARDQLRTGTIRLHVTITIYFYKLSTRILVT